MDSEGFRLFREVVSQQAAARGGRWRIMDETTGDRHELVIPPDLPDEAWVILSTLDLQRFPAGALAYDREAGEWRWIEPLGDG